MKNLPINLNLLNYVFNDSLFFNENFFFFFFNNSWLKTPLNVVKLAILFKHLRVGLVFFFKPTSRVHLSNMFSKNGFITSGLVSQKSVKFYGPNFYDFPLILQTTSILHFYIFYSVFFNFKLKITKLDFNFKPFKFFPLFY